MDKTLKYWNTQGEMKHSNSSFKGWVTAIENINKGKEHYMAVGCMDGSVSILDHEYSIVRTIKGEDYGVSALSASDEGDFLFVAYKNGIVKLFSLGDATGEDVQKQVIETNTDVNAVDCDIRNRNDSYHRNVDNHLATILNKAEANIDSRLFASLLVFVQTYIVDEVDTCHCCIVLRLNTSVKRTADKIIKRKSLQCTDRFVCYIHRFKF